MTILLLYTVSYFSENRPLPGSDSHPLFKYASTRSVFELLLLIHMKTLKRWKYNSIPYRVCVMQQSRTEKNRTANPHPPQKIKDEAAQKPKRAILSFLIRGEMGAGGGGLNFPSVLSKIVVARWCMTSLDSKNSVFDHPHVNKRMTILKISSC